MLDSSFDFEDAYPDIVVSKTISADRRQVRLSVTDARLVGLGTICASAEVRDDRESSNDFSSTFDFLLDGFDAADGALAREVRSYLEGAANIVSWRLRPRNATGGAGVRARCKEIYRTEFSCHMNGRLHKVPGRATLSLRGRMRFDARDARKWRSDAPDGWQPNIRATLNWRRCPRSAPKPLRGKRCHSSVRWRGGRELADAFGL